MTFYPATISDSLTRIELDILIGSTVPLHPHFGKDPLLSLQLVQGGKVLDETRAVAGDDNGIWEIDSPLNLYAIQYKALYSMLTAP